MSDEFLPFACSASSLQADEPSYASIKPARYWLMLEYDHPWGSKALPDSDIPEAVKKYLNRLQEVQKSMRTLLLRQQPRLVRGGLRLFLAVADELEPQLYEFELQEYEQIPDLDLGTLLQFPEKLRARRREAPIFLICTNGKRDPCCAGNGLPVYRRLADEGDASIWQTSHVGGHRFAANMVCMPHGLFYGRVEPELAREIKGAYQTGRLIPSHYRGRACYAKPVQAAEYFLRKTQGLNVLSALKLVSAEEQSTNLWDIKFTQQTEESLHTVTLQVQPEAYQVLSSCHDNEHSPAPGYRLVGLSATKGSA